MANGEERNQQTVVVTEKKGWAIPLLVAVVVILVAILVFQSCGGPTNVLNNSSKQTTVSQPQTTKPTSNVYEAPPVIKQNGRFVEISGKRAYHQTGKGLTDKVKLNLASDEVALVSALRFNNEAYFGQIRILTNSGEYVLHDGDIFITSKQAIKDQLVWKLKEFKANPTWALARIDTLTGVDPAGPEFGFTNKKVETVVIN